MKDGQAIGARLAASGAAYSKCQAGVNSSLGVIYIGKAGVLSSVVGDSQVVDDLSVGNQGRAAV